MTSCSPTLPLGRLSAEGHNVGGNTYWWRHAGTWYHINDVLCLTRFVFAVFVDLIIYRGAPAGYHHDHKQADVDRLVVSACDNGIPIGASLSTVMSGTSRNFRETTKLGIKRGHYRNGGYEIGG